MYLLDTDILSNLMRRSPSTILIAKLASVPVEQQFTSSITLGELVYGAYRLEGRTDAFLERLAETLLPNLPIFPFDAAAAYHYGEVRAQLERQGTPLGEADLRIAAIALVHGHTVVTGNVRHFQRVPGLSVENWFEPS
jgi:predicted nucleic acid-binding protein